MTNRLVVSMVCAITGVTAESLAAVAAALDAAVVKILKLPDALDWFARHTVTDPLNADLPDSCIPA